VKSNQEIERHYFEMFRRDYDVPQGVVVYGDKPDVVIDGDRKVGIEVTRFYLEDGQLPTSEQRQRKLREEVAFHAQRRFFDAGGKRVELSFSFNNRHPIRDVSSTVARIVDVARLNEEHSSGLMSKERFAHIPELSFIYWNAIEYDDPVWRVTQCYEGKLMSMHRLREIVCAKEASSADYKPCDMYWLLVVVDSMNAAQDQEIRIEEFEKFRSTVFDRVIVYKTLFGHILEVT
jgi:hypothetical protein